MVGAESLYLTNVNQSPMAMVDTIDTIIKRLEILQLVNESPRTKAEMKNEIGISRSTVDRAVSELGECKLIKRNPPAGYQLSSRGKPIFHLFLQFSRCLDELISSSTKLHLPGGRMGELVMFYRCEKILPHPTAPDKPLESLKFRTEEYSCLKMFSPLIFQGFLDIWESKLSENDSHTSIILTNEAYQYLFQNLPNENLANAWEEESKFQSTNIELSYGLLVGEKDHYSEASLILFSDSGVNAIILNRTPAAVAWARGTIDHLSKDLDLSNEENSPEQFRL